MRSRATEAIDVVMATFQRMEQMLVSIEMQNLEIAPITQSTDVRSLRSHSLLILSCHHLSMSMMSWCGLNYFQQENNLIKVNRTVMAKVLESYQVSAERQLSFLRSKREYLQHLN